MIQDTRRENDEAAPEVHAIFEFHPHLLCLGFDARSCEVLESFLNILNPCSFWQHYFPNIVPYYFFLG